MRRTALAADPVGILSGSQAGSLHGRGVHASCLTNANPPAVAKQVGTNILLAAMVAVDCRWSRRIARTSTQQRGLSCSVVSISSAVPCAGRGMESLRSARLSKIKPDVCSLGCAVGSATASLKASGQTQNQCRRAGIKAPRTCQNLLLSCHVIRHGQEFSALSRSGPKAAGS